MPRRHPHFLQSFRKKNALSQEEMAFLLGCRTGTQVSQYERLRRQPSVETMLTCQAIFGVPVDKLFPVLYEEVELETKKRARLLSEKIRHGGMSGRAEQKLKLLNEIISRKAEEPTTLPWEKKTLAAS